MAYLIGLTVAVIVVLAIISSRRSREREEAMLRDVQRHGFKVEITRRTGFRQYRFTGVTNGVPWTIITGDNQSSEDSGPASTIWSTNAAVLRDGVLAVWPSSGKPDVVAGSATHVPQFVSKLILMPLIAALGADTQTTNSLATAVPVPAEHPVIGANYYLRATDPALMQRFLAAGARDALVAAASWLKQKESFLIIALIWSRGLSINLYGRLTDAKRIGQLGAFGAALTDAFRKSASFTARSVGPPER